MGRWLSLAVLSLALVASADARQKLKRSSKDAARDRGLQMTVEDDYYEYTDPADQSPMLASDMLLQLDGVLPEVLLATATASASATASGTASATATRTATSTRTATPSNTPSTSVSVSCE
jgi:hypothetical protein